MERPKTPVDKFLAAKRFSRENALPDETLYFGEGFLVLVMPGHVSVLIKDLRDGKSYWGSVDSFHKSYTRCFGEPNIYRTKPTTEHPQGEEVISVGNIHMTERDIEVDDAQPIKNFISEQGCGLAVESILAILDLNSRTINASSDDASAYTGENLLLDEYKSYLVGVLWPETLSAEA